MKVRLLGSSDVARARGEELSHSEEEVSRVDERDVERRKQRHGPRSILRSRSASDPVSASPRGTP